MQINTIEWESLMEENFGELTLQVFGERKFGGLIDRPIGKV